MRAPFLFVLFTAIVGAQISPNPRPTLITQYLSLTASQLTSITANNNRLARLIAEKEIRRAQLLREIAIETNKTPLDPVGLGLRYAEAETICRDIRDAETRTRQDNVALLTEPQRVRMRALEEAVKLLPVATQAESFNLADFGGLSFSVGSSAFLTQLPIATFGRSSCGGVPGFAGRILDPLPPTGMSVDHRQDPQQHQQ